MLVRNTLGRTVILSGAGGGQIVLRPGATVECVPVETAVFGALVKSGKVVIEGAEQPPKRTRRKAD
ncbi:MULTISPECIES: hypothetical protein [unclassified Haematobacter]|uniref:hypothetical protein n=1 Tax=unclassified Haematobacter TaxID=2640585 RepID=UPI0025C6CD1A|nr:MULTISPECIES: hypothetical protein [unclassified Haematobacter]